MSYTPIGPRASKEEFMQALRLDPNNSQHESWYRSMRDEAIAVYSELNASPSNLIETQRGKGTQPPYFWHHIKPDKRREAVMKTWNRARPGTSSQKLFDRGATNGEHGPNWVTLWLLYSVFRSRDIRNNRNRRNGDEQRSNEAPRAGGASGDGRIYDPARNTHIPR